MWRETTCDERRRGDRRARPGARRRLLAPGGQGGTAAEIVVAVVPVVAALESDPHAFVRGLGRGTAGLVGGVLGGVTSSVSGVGLTVTKNLSLVSADAAYIAERERRRRKFEAAAGGAGAGLAAGGAEIARGLADGIGGIFVAPVRGAQEAGGLGFLKATAARNRTNGDVSHSVVE